jgi:hypothetical protein
LCRGLRWNNVVVPVKIEGAFSAAMGREEALGRIRGINSRNARSHALTIKTRFPQVGSPKNPHKHDSFYLEDFPLG